MPTQSKLLPLWIRFAGDQKLAGINALSPLYLRSQGADYGGGDFGCLYALLDKAKETGFSVIQLLPLYDTGSDTSPYMPVSFFALNPVFLWVDDPIFEGIGEEIKERQIKWSKTQIPQYIDYIKLREFKMDFLRVAFKELGGDSEFIEYKQNCNQQTQKWAEFSANKEIVGIDWQDWEKDKLKITNSHFAKASMDTYELRINKETDFHLFIQWVLEKQLLKVKEYAQTNGIYLCMDKPLYPALQSSDVWANQNLFYLKNDGYPQYVSGCSNPGDSYGDQIWGHAVFQFQEKEELVRNYFIESIDYLARFSHVIRLDHVLALIWKYYLIDPETNKGEHRLARGMTILQELIDKFSHIYFIGEDSGFESEMEVDKPLEQLGLSGIRCLQWETKHNQDFEKYPTFSVAYTSTHDSLSTVGWWTQLTPAKRHHWQERLNIPISIPHQTIANHLARHILKSPTQLVIVGINDLIGDIRRFNTPGTNNGHNWQIRMLRKINELDTSLISGFIRDTKRENTGLSESILVGKPNYPRLMIRNLEDTINFEIASDQKLNKILIHSNLSGFDVSGNWGTKEIDLNKCHVIQFGQIYLWQYKLDFPGSKIGLYELAISIWNNKGEITFLNHFNNNLKINVLKKS